MHRRRIKRSMRSELGSAIPSLIFLDLRHEEDYIDGTLLIEYDQSSSISEQSRDGSCCRNQTAMHNRVSNNQRSYSGSWVQRPRIDRMHVPVYSVYATASLTVRSIRTTTSTIHHIILSVRAHYMCTCLYVRGRNVRACL